MKRGSPIIIAFAITAILRGAGLIVGNAAVDTTGLALFFRATNDKYVIVALFLITTGVMAITGMYAINVFRAVLLLLPQMLTWLFYCVSAIWNIFTGVYSNGYAPPVHPHLFIYEDQIYLIGFFAAYIYEITRIIKKQI